MRDSSLCELVLDMTAGSTRRWTLREDNQSHYHGVVSLNESPLLLELLWRPNATAQVSRVGLFRLNLEKLLAGGYIRRDPVDSIHGNDVRVRFVQANGRFYIQTRSGEPRVECPSAVSGTHSTTT